MLRQGVTHPGLDVRALGEHVGSVLAVLAVRAALGGHRGSAGPQQSSLEMHL